MPPSLKDRVCEVEGCGKPLCSRGLCVNHYRIRRKSGELPLLERKPPRVCKVDTCNRPLLARGWCATHYARWHRLDDAGENDPIDPTDGFIKCGRCQRNKEATLFTEGKTWCKRCVSVWAANRRKAPTCMECQAPITSGSKSGLCVPCNGVARRAKTPVKSVNPGGYITLTAYWGHPNASARGRILEHVLVMGDMLGRPLQPGENVHHINGVKTDNRPENLELWVSSQPSGQRPADLVAWAHNILERYDVDYGQRERMSMVRGV